MVKTANRKSRRRARRAAKRNRRRPGQMAIPRLHSKPINVVLFAGLGGSTLGLEQAGIRVDVAVNHDPEAVAVHATNHAATEHLCESVFDTSPTAVCRGREVGVLWASPDCTDHSNAKGDKPRSSGRRALAWVVVDWAREVRPGVIMAENVVEFEDWGPLVEVHVDDCTDDDRALNGGDCIDGCRFNRRDNTAKGTLYDEWVAALVALGYRYARQELRACDYGAPTTRNRLYMVFVHESTGREPRFPSPTHGPGLLPYATAADCIDFTIPCPSVFLTRAEVRELGLKCKRPLADKTLRRVARGIWKYVIRSAKPFIVNYHSATSENGHRVVDLDKPIPTLDTSNRFGLIAPALVQTGYGEREGQAPRSLDLHQPLGVVVSCGAKHAVASAFLAKHYSERKPNEVQGSPLDRSMDTVTCTDHHSLVTTNLVKLYGTSDAADMRHPMPTVTATGNHLAEVRALLTKYPDTDAEPTTDQTVWINGESYVVADVGLRMLVPRELATANGFPRDHIITVDIDGKPLSGEAQVRLIGNVVVPAMAKALAEANCAHLIETERAA